MNRQELFKIFDKYLSIGYTFSKICREILPKYKYKNSSRLTREGLDNILGKDLAYKLAETEALFSNHCKHYALKDFDRELTLDSSTKLRIRKLVDRGVLRESEEIYTGSREHEDHLETYKYYSFTSNHSCTTNEDEQPKTLKEATDNFYRLLPYRKKLEAIYKKRDSLLEIEVSSFIENLIRHTEDREKLVYTLNLNKETVEYYFQQELNKFYEECKPVWNKFTRKFDRRW